MGLNKTRGNMYRWVSHTWSPIGGRCPHKCVYCYIDNMDMEAVKKKFGGEPRFHPTESKTRLGSGKTIFVQNMGDAFASEVPDEVIEQVIEHINKYPLNRYLLQTKNPMRMAFRAEKLPPMVILGTTVESDKPPQSKAPEWRNRIAGMMMARTRYNDSHSRNCQIMLSVEPITEIIDMVGFVDAIERLSPDFVSIGADSQDSKLVEPDGVGIDLLVKKLSKFTTVVLKPNLSRLVDVEEIAKYKNVVMVENYDEIGVV